MDVYEYVVGEAKMTDILVFQVSRRNVYYYILSSDAVNSLGDTV